VVCQLGHGSRERHNLLPIELAIILRRNERLFNLHSVALLLKPCVIGGNRHNVDFFEAIRSAIDIQIELVVDHVVVLFRELAGSSL
jgi:hypothetical protein